MPDPLVFGPPERREHVGTGGAPPGPHTPDASRQGKRLTSQFRDLEQTLDEQRAALLAAGVDADPELIAVFDLIGSIDGFYRAVARIEGLEFLADFEDDELPPDEDFFMEKDGDRSDESLPHSLYLVATNTGAIRDLLNMWAQWVQDPTADFPHGLGRVKELFAQLRAIRQWGPEDRLRDSGVVEDWTVRVELAAQQSVPVEVELWYRADEERQRAAEGAVLSAFTEAGGEVLDTAVLPHIRYHGVLGSLPRGAIQQVLNGDLQGLALFVTEEVMFVRPASRVLADLPGDVEDQPVPDLEPARPAGDPRVALLDGLPLAGHQALAERLEIADPDGVEESYPAAARQHGTSMASLIIHGDLSEPGTPLASRLYARPVLLPNPNPVGAREAAPPGRLFVDVLHRAIHDLFRGPPEVRRSTIKVIALSICDESRHFVRDMSPLARLLDWAAHEFNVLIVVSAGNHSESVTLDVDADEIANIADAELQSAAVARVHAEGLHRRLLAPAESMNALTVGASASDAAGDVADQRLDLFVVQSLPAPYSARGTGFGRSVKPDALYPGGRVRYEPPLPGAPAPSELHATRTAAHAPGVLSAAPGVSGSTTSVLYGHGTSQAAALAAHAAGLACETLERLRDADPDNPCLDEAQWPQLLKAMTAHPARWREAREVYVGAAGLERPALTQALGYGAVDPEEVTNSVAARAVLIGSGRLSHKDTDVFSLPLPPGLRARADWRRLTITLAWFTPIAAQTRRRRAARLWFEPPTTGVGVDRSEADYHAVRRGTLQHEVLEGAAALAFTDGEAVSIEVNCRIDHLPASTTVAYGLVASVEVAPALGIDVHSEISEQLRARATARVQV